MDVVKETRMDKTKTVTEGGWTIHGAASLLATAAFHLGDIVFGIPAATLRGAREFLEKRLTEKEIGETIEAESQKTWGR